MSEEFSAESQGSLIVFGSRQIRRKWHDDQWFFSVVDIVAALTDSSNPRNYWNMMKAREQKDSGVELYTLCVQLKLTSSDGKSYKTECANTEAAFRIIQSIPSPKAEPFKRWLAEVGYQRVQEIENPELAQQRMRQLYKDKGYPDDWIEKRMRGMAVRDELTDEWKRRGIDEQKDFAILTAEISKATFGLTPSEYQRLKGLKRENLRDHMNDLELIFTMLGEAATTEIARNKDARGFIPNKSAAHEGGTIAGDARRQLELKSGKRVVTRQNYLHAKPTTETQIAEFEVARDKVIFEMRLDERQIQAVDQRISALNADLQKFRDEIRLRDRGTVSNLATAKGLCPTCNQPIKDTLLPQSIARNPMSLEQNVSFIEEQMTPFRNIRDDSNRALGGKRAKIAAMDQSLAELRSLAHRQRETLQADGRTPSVASIQERIQAEDRLSRLEQLNDAFQGILEKFKNLSAQYNHVETELSRLKSDNLTFADRDKLRELDRSFKEQLTAYGFSSFPLSEVEISEVSYRPSHLGYDLGFTSASDTIRSIWAFHLGLLEVARSSKTRHWGMLIFDEPKQQSAKDMSFEALLKRASVAGAFNQQIVFGTSQDEKSLLAMIKNLDVQLLLLPQRFWESSPHSRTSTPTTSSTRGEESIILYPGNVRRAFHTSLLAALPRRL